MDRPLPILDVDAVLDDAFALLSGGAAGLLAIRGGRPVGVITKLDLLEYLTHAAQASDGMRGSPNARA